MIHCKRYLARAGDRYYPSEYGNVIGIFDTVTEAIDAAKAHDCFLGTGMRWVSVFDLLRREVVLHEDDYETMSGEWDTSISREIEEDVGKT
jgi:hypothetical protein